MLVSTPALRPLHLTLLLLALIPMSAACGPPELCTQQGGNSFSNFRNSDWTPYCADLNDRLQQPMNYELILLTEFFSEYPERASQMKGKLATFTEYDKCFVSKDDQLAYRKLNSCLESREVETRIKRAWTVRAEPWLEDYQKRVKKLSIDLDAAERDAEYITTKISQQESLSMPVKIERVGDFGDDLDEMQKEVALIDRAKDDYERLKSASMAYESLNGHIENTLAQEISNMFEAHDANRFAIARLRNTQRFHTFATQSVGVPCEEGIRAPTEERVAKKLLSQTIDEIDASKNIRMTSKAVETTDESTGDKTKTFEGFICGKRGINNQFDGKFKLCSAYTFTITSTKPAAARRYGDWTLESITEGDEKQGVDCNLLEGPKKP